MVISLLVSLLANGMTILADRYDSQQKRKLEETKKKLEETNFIQKAVVDSLKKIHINTKEIDSLKILVNNDAFIKKIANLISKQTNKNDLIDTIAAEVRKYCDFKEDQVLTIEPFIKSFIQELYDKILENPQFSPYLIINKIEAESNKIRKDISEGVEKVVEKIFESTTEIFNEIKKNNTHKVPSDQGTQSTFIPSCDTENKLTASTIISGASKSPRLKKMLSRQFEKVLENLNIHFKARADVVKEIQKKKDFNQAIELYKSLLEKADETIDEDIILGIYADCSLCSINIDDIESANDWLCKAEEIASNDKRILAIRGLYYYELGEKVGAKEYADKALAIDEFYHLALILKTATELEAGYSGESILNKYFFDESGILRGGFNHDHMAVISRTIAQCYSKDNKFDKAVEYFEKSLKLDPSDDGTYSLLGTTYLNKVVGDRAKIIEYHERLSPEKEELVRKAIEYFTKALELAARYNKIKDHISTNVNRSTCYMLLGDYDKAYDISGMSTTTEDLLKSKAVAAYYKGLFTEANKLLSKVKNATALDITNRVLALLNSANKKNALELIEESLNNESFSEDEIALIRYLRFEILLSEKDKENVEKELKKLEISTLPEWQKEKAIGDYYELIDDHNKADIHYQKALRHSDIAIPTKIFIADFYFVKEDYKTCFDICSSLSLGVIKSDLDILKRLLQMLVVSSFHISELDKCRDYINYGKQQKIEDSYLYEISASIYWQKDELEKARDELFTILSRQANANSLSLISNFALVSFLLGDLLKAQEYFLLAEKMTGFYKNTNDVINSIIVFIVIGNKIEAKRIFEKALDLKFENKDDKIHKFAPGFYLRKNNANLFAKYAIKFNKKHGDTAWLWKKDVKKDEEELKTIFSESIRQSTEIKTWYCKYPIPLVFLPSLLRKREIIHLWSFNREYDLPVFLESGNPKELKDEISILSKNKSILVDYTALLTLQEVGSEYLWVLDNAFDEIFIYRPMYLQMLNELMLEEHDGLRQIIKFISESKKIKFLKKVSVKTLNIQDKALSNLMQEEYSGLFQTAHEKQMVLLIGEVRLRWFAISLGVVACGIRSLLEHTKHRNIIDSEALNKGIINLIKKDAQFISFNRDTLECLYMYYPLEEFKSVFNKLSDQIFLSGSEIESFTNVYCGFIKKIIASMPDSQIIKYLLKKTIGDIKGLTSRAIDFGILPFLNENFVLADMYKINEICLGYIGLLIVLIHSSKIDEQLKSEYFETIKNEANLAYWYEKLIIDNRNIISYIFEKAQIASKGDKI